MPDAGRVIAKETNVAITATLPRNVIARTPIVRDVVPTNTRSLRRTLLRRYVVVAQYKEIGCSEKGLP